MTRVRIVDIAKAFGPIWAVRGVTLGIGEGEFFSFRLAKILNVSERTRRRHGSSDFLDGVGDNDSGRR